MKNITLNCYKDFRCKTGDCKHNCCLLWEISLDKKFLSFLKENSELNLITQNGVDFKNRRFILQDGRCPFLNNDNLCELVLKYGKKVLPKTCTIHPVFKCFLPSATLFGYGLCCEEACHLLLNFDKPLKIVCEKTDAKSKHMSSLQRKTLYKLTNYVKILNNNMPFMAKLEYLFKDFNICNSISVCEFLSIDFNKLFSGFELLDKSHIYLFDGASADFGEIENHLEKHNEKYSKLLFYFLFRHLCNGVDGLDVVSRALFGVFSVTAIANAFIKTDTGNYNELEKICVEYSIETEYSNKNFFAVLDFIEDFLSRKTLQKSANIKAIDEKK